MAIFIDSADLDDIREITKWGVISGCTTNPAIAAKAAGAKGKFDFKERIAQIIDIVKGPVSVELLSESSEEMIEEAKTYYQWNKEFVVIKVPISIEGLKVISCLERKEGIKTNARSANWYVSIGNMLVAGCQILFLHVLELQVHCLDRGVYRC